MAESPPSGRAGALRDHAGQGHCSHGITCEMCRTWPTGQREMAGAAS